MRHITKPMFLSTGWKYQKIERRPYPTYVDGVLVDGAPETITIKANIQPVSKSNGTQFLPEEAKVKRAVIGWSTTELYQKEDHRRQFQADKFIWNGEEYEVVKSITWDMGPLNHCEFLAMVVDPI